MFNLSLDSDGHTLNKSEQNHCSNTQKNTVSLFIFQGIYKCLHALTFMGYSE